jgi:hypothetical protein
VSNAENQNENGFFLKRLSKVFFENSPSAFVRSHAVHHAKVISKGLKISTIKYTARVTVEDDEHQRNYCAVYNRRLFISAFRVLGDNLKRSP